MKKIKISISVLALLLLSSLLFTACGDRTQNGNDNGEYFEEPDYSGLVLSEYVRLGEYKGLTVNAQLHGLTKDLALWGYIIENAEVLKYPEQPLEYYRDQTTRRYRHYADEAGVEYEEILEELGITPDDVEAEARDYVKEDLVQLAIIEAEGIELTEEEKADLFDKYAEKYITVYGYSEEYMRENLTDKIYDSMLYDKMLEFLILHNEFVTEE